MTNTTKTALLVAMTLTVGLVTGPLTGSAWARPASDAQQASVGQSTATPTQQTTPSAAPAQTAAQPAEPTTTSSEGVPASASAAASGALGAGDQLPVSLDRIRRGLKAETPPNAPIQREIDTKDGVPRFAVRTESPRTIKLSDFLANNKTAVPAYVRPPFDPYHYEFLEMITPDEVKGCMQFDNATCLQSNAGRLASGLLWQQLLGSSLRGLFANP